MRIDKKLLIRGNEFANERCLILQLSRMLNIAYVSNLVMTRFWVTDLILIKRYKSRTLTLSLDSTIPHNVLKTF